MFETKINYIIFFLRILLLFVVHIYKYRLWELLTFSLNSLVILNKINTNGKPEIIDFQFIDWQKNIN